MLIHAGRVFFHFPPPDWSQLEWGADVTLAALAVLALLTGTLLARKRRRQFAARVAVAALLLAVVVPAQAQESEAEARKAKAAAARLAKDEAKRKVSAFKSAIKKERDAEKIIDALRTLTDTKHLVVLKALAPLVAHPHPDVMEEANRSVADVGRALPPKERAAGVAILVTTFRHAKKRPACVIASVRALASLGDVAAVPHLIKLIESKDNAIAAAAITALGSVKSLKSIDPLIKALAKVDFSNSWGVGTATGSGGGTGSSGASPGAAAKARRKAIEEPCRAALRAITGQNISKSALWKKWWKANKRTFRLEQPQKK